MYEIEDISEEFDTDTYSIMHNGELYRTSFLETVGWVTKDEEGNEVKDKEEAFEFVKEVHLFRNKDNV